MRFVNISGMKDGFMANGAASRLQEEGLDFEFRYFYAPDLDEDPILLNEALGYMAEADFIAFKIHGDTSYFKKFDRVEKVIERNRIPTLVVCHEEAVQTDYRHMFPFSDQEYLRCLAYMELSGDSNFSYLIRWALVKFGGMDIEVPDPIQPPAQGLYYPGRESIDIGSYVDGLDLSKPTVGVFFYQRQWLADNMAHIDAIIRDIESLGANAVPVFMVDNENKVVGSIGLRNILMDHLMKDGKPVLDSMLMNMGFSQIVVVAPGAGEQECNDNFFAEYGAPVIQTPTMSRSAEKWREDINGLRPSEIAFDIAHPEFDGQIISTACASIERMPDGTTRAMPLEERTRRVAETAVNWARLRHIPDSERKVGIIMYNYPPKNSSAGGASFLDTFQSVVEILHRMRDLGYDVGDEIPETSRELVDTLMAGLTNDLTWVSDENIADRAADMVKGSEYAVWYSQLSENARKRLEDGWGKPPGEFYSVGDDLMIPGVIFGNVIVSFQPDRGRDIQKNYHSPHIVMTHQYLAYYRWLKYDFKVDAVIHLGTHGTLEWLPGKSVALCEDCCPDYILDSIPDVYPYIIDNPGEGTQAKRRSEAVLIDHMVATMTRAGSYEDIQELEGAVQNWYEARSQKQDDKMEIIRVKLREIVDRLGYYNDLKMSPDCTDAEFDSRIDDLYDYLVEVKGALIKDGLHILGHVQEGRRMEEDIYSLTRLANGEVPSMRGSVASYLGYDILDLQQNSSEPDERTGRMKGQVLDDVEDRMESLISEMHGAGFVLEECHSIIDREYPGDNADLKKVAGFVCGELYPNLLKMGDELTNVMRALRGEYIEPGPSGCPTRGRAQLLPTGKNFYSLDPDAIPWHSSWEVGKQMADQMLERYLNEHGMYPKNIGIVVWATDTLKTGGDDIAYILWLMGLRPVWTGYAGRVKGIEVIPLEELGRPRIDVTLRISGLFRDTFPNLVEMIDQGVRMISELDESDDENYLRANIREDIVRSIAEGMPEDEARENAQIRIFGDAPGTYGSGTNILIRTSDWQDVKDLGEIYQSYGHYAYGNGRKGKTVTEAFRRRLEQMQVTVKNSPSRENDMIDSDDVYNDLGGLNAAVRAVSGKMPMSVIGISADVTNIKTKTIDEECRYIFRSKIQNPKWVEGLKQHGFKGAEEISNMTEYVLAWDATSGIIDDWQYQTIADNFLFDEENSEWLRDVNPYAMFATASRLLEAVGREMWEPDEDTRRRLEQIYMELEGEFEGKE